jgi:hypothetical protein
VSHFVHVVTNKKHDTGGWAPQQSAVTFVMGCSQANLYFNNVQRHDDSHSRADIAD